MELSSLSFPRRSRDIRVTGAGDYTAVTSASSWGKRLNSEQKQKYSGYLGGDRGRHMVRFYPTSGEIYGGDSISFLRGSEEHILQDIASTRNSIRESLEKQVLADPVIKRLRNMADGVSVDRRDRLSADSSLRRELRVFLKQYNKLQQKLMVFSDTGMQDREIKAKDVKRLNNRVQRLLNKFGVKGGSLYRIFGYDRQEGRLSSLFRRFAGRLPLIRRYYARRATGLFMAEMGQKAQQLTSRNKQEILDQILSRKHLHLATDGKSLLDEEGKKVSLDNERALSISQALDSFKDREQDISALRSSFLSRYDGNSEYWQGLCARNGIRAEDFEDRSWLFKKHFENGLQVSLKDVEASVLWGEKEEVLGAMEHSYEKLADDIMGKLNRMSADKVSVLGSIESRLGGEIWKKIAVAVKQDDVLALVSGFLELGKIGNEWLHNDGVLNPESGRSEVATDERIDLQTILVKHAGSLSSPEKQEIYDYLRSDKGNDLAIILGCLYQDSLLRSSFGATLSSQDADIITVLRTGGVSNFGARINGLIKFLGTNLGQDEKQVRLASNNFLRLMGDGEEMFANDAEKFLSGNKDGVTREIISEASKLSGSSGDSEQLGRVLSALGGLWRQDIPSDFRQKTVEEQSQFTKTWLY